MTRNAVPLLIASYGRSGSSALMRALGAADRILIPAVFPHETRMAQYVLVGRMLGLTGDAPDSIAWRKAAYQPHQPVDHVAGDWFAAHRTGFFDRRNLLDEYAALLIELAGSQGGDEGLAVYLAEKTIGLDLVQPALEEDASRRALLLLRDPRDIFISAKAFNRRRGYLSFGETPDPAADEGMLRDIISFSHGALAIAASRSDQTLVLRYETMLAEPESVFGKVLAWLGIEPDPRVIRHMTERLGFIDDRAEQHMTSSGAAESVDRWRSIPSGSRFMTLFRAQEEALQGLGYPIA